MPGSDPVMNSPGEGGLPPWAAELRALYESGAASQFILHGNVHDRLLLPLADAAELGGLPDFLVRVLMPRFDVILSYDLGSGIRVEKGGAIFEEWPTVQADPALPRRPRAAIEALTHYFRRATRRTRHQCAGVRRSASLGR